MARYRKQQTLGDNLRDLYSKQVQQTSAGLGSSSIDWDDDGDDGESLDITVSDSTVAKYGHFGDAHGFLVIGGGTGWRTVQADAQIRADAAESAANSHANSLNTAMDGRMDTAESEMNTAQADINTLQSEMNTAQADINTAQSDINTLQSQMTNRTSRIAAIEAALDLHWPGWGT